MKWNDCSHLRSTLVVTASFGIFFEGVVGWEFTYFISRILWSQVYPREILRNLEFLNR